MKIHTQGYSLINKFVSVGSPQSSQQDQSGNVTDEEVELKQNISRSRNPSSDLMIEDPRPSRAPMRCYGDSRGSKEVLSSVDISDKSKHVVDINKDPLNVEGVKQGSPETRAKLLPAASNSDAKLPESENEARNAQPLLTKANSTKEDPSAKFISSGSSAATDDKKPNFE